MSSNVYFLHSYTQLYGHLQIIDSLKLQALYISYVYGRQWVSHSIITNLRSERPCSLRMISLHTFDLWSLPHTYVLSHSLPYRIYLPQYQAPSPTNKHHLATLQPQTPHRRTSCFPKHRTSPRSAVASTRLAQSLKRHYFMSKMSCAVPARPTSRPWRTIERLCKWRQRPWRGRRARRMIGCLPNEGRGGLLAYYLFALANCKRESYGALQAAKL